MKRRYSFAAFGKREYLKMKAWLKTASSVGLDGFAAVRPQPPVRPRVAVADRMTEREAHRVRLRLESARELEQAFDRVGKLVEPRFLHPAHAVIQSLHGPAD